MEESRIRAQNWTDLLGPEKTEPYFQTLLDFVAERRTSAQVFPPGSQTFEALKLCKLENLKVVIVGQDPYHGPGQAHGLSFSVQVGVPKPPSLKNIFKELHSDLGIEQPDHGCLASWAEQGVLMLNSVLTVERSKPQSHANRGWERFTDKLIEQVNIHCEKLVFVLWGSSAQKKGRQINTQRHMVLKSPHPSPLSAHRGFFGCQHFSKCNQYLQSVGREPIDWKLC